eukprot:19217-Prymnesium_polylepis.1
MVAPGGGVGRYAALRCLWHGTRYVSMRGLLGSRRVPSTPMAYGLWPMMRPGGGIRRYARPTVRSGTSYVSMRGLLGSRRVPS